jgi:hypothetical protein
MIISLLSNALFFIILLAIGGAWLLFRRRHLLRLFRVSRRSGLQIYLSRIHVMRGGSVGFDGLPRSFSGPTVTASEAGASALIAGLFEYIIPGLEAQPGILKTLFTRDISVEVFPSPLNIADLPRRGSVVTVGSPGYNVVSSWAQTSLNPKVLFSPNNDLLITNGGRQINDTTIGMVQILYDAQNQRRVFYLAGLSEVGTRAALLYVATKWRDLYKNIGDQEVFCCLVKLRNGDAELTETIY